MEGVSDHRAVEVEYITEMESGGYGKKGLARLRLEEANETTQLPGPGGVGSGTRICNPQ